VILARLGRSALQEPQEPQALKVVSAPLFIWKLTKEIKAILGHQALLDYKA